MDISILCTITLNIQYLTMATLGFFNLERGVRQGCPLSAYLFILAMDILANKIRHEKDIKGIKIDKEEIKLSMLADDLTLILQD